MKRGTVAVLLAAMLFSAVACTPMNGSPVLSESASSVPTEEDTVLTERTEETVSDSLESEVPPTPHTYFCVGFTEAARGETVSVTLYGCRPGERIVCRVRYISGWSNTKGLGLGVADEKGQITWTWMIGGSVKTGEGSVLYLMDENGDEIGSFPFTVTETEKETEAGIESGTGTDTDLETGTETDAEIETETESESDTEAETDLPEVEYRTVLLVGGMTATVFDGAGRGTTVTVTLTGAVPGKTYTCKMSTKSGQSTAAGLGEAVADATGTVSWTWRLGSRLSLDFAPTVTVTDRETNEIISFTFQLTE